jgi:hypothetical protein
LTAVWIAVGSLGALAIAEALAIVALAREVGVISLRLPPVPALDSGDGPPLDAALPTSEVINLSSGEVRSLGGGSKKARVVLLLSTTCDACRVVLQELQAIQADWRDHEFIPVVAGEARDVEAMRRRSGFRGALYYDGGEAMEKLGVRATPAGIVVDPAGRVKAKGVVNSREMVSSLLTGRVRMNHGLVERELIAASRPTNGSA